jgi:1-acyl-sn-glycerol-3-phosphate acyltransferase
VVLLISLIPNADCIVKAEHWKNPLLRLILSSIYIPNSLNVVETIKACKKSLAQGNHIILFPEGTRTPKGTSNIRLHRSAAQIALRTGTDILPVQINCSEHSGLSKNDSIWDSPANGIIDYSILVGKRIKPQNYMDLPMAIGARRLTNKLKIAIITPSKNKE